MDATSTRTRSPTSTPTTSGSQPVGRVRQGAVGPRPAARVPQGPGQPVGQHDRGRLARPRLLRRRLGGPERRRRPAAPLHGRQPDRAAARHAGRDAARRLARGVPLEARPRRDRARASSARRRCRGPSRRDYVENSNDSYWLPSARFRLPGFARIIGAGGHAARAAHAARARCRPSSGSPAPTGSARPASRSARCSRSCFGNRNLSAELAQGRDGRRVPRERPRRSRRGVRRARRLGRPRRHRLARRGAVARVLAAASTPAPWTVPFDANDPVDDAARLRRQRGRSCCGADRARSPTCAARASRSTCRSAQLQAEPRGNERIPIHGCTDDEGCFNVISDRPRRAGPLRPVHGSSFVMTAAFDNKGRPRGEAILTLLAVREPALAALRRPDAAVLAEEVAADAVHRAVDPPRRRTTSGRW